MIEVEHLFKSYDGKTIVDDVSFRVETGTFCMLVGTSGSGKSTTLRLINRLIEPDKGTIRIHGEDVTRISGDLLRRRIGYAIQGIGLFPHRTVFDNIATVPRLLKWSEDKVRARVFELLELFHLDYASFAGQYPHQLSGGQQQRVGVARALAARPDVLLMDEPFAALDPITREHLQDEMLRIQKQLGITLVMVTHDMEEAVRMGDMIAVMDEGKILQMATPETLLRDPEEGYVRSLVGGVDRSLHILSLSRVSDVLETRQMSDGAETPDGTRQGHLKPTDSLRDALCHLIWKNRQSAPVFGEHGQFVGQVRLQDILARGAEA